MKRLAKYIVCLLLLPLFTTTCAVHEWPEPAEADALLTFHFNRDLPPFLTVDYTTNTRVSESGMDYDFRYVVNAYRKKPDGDFSRTPDRTFVFSKDDVTEPNHQERVKMDEGSYKFMAWVDYVGQGKLDDMFYNPDNFENIRVNTNYLGNTDFRDAFIGETEATIIRYGTEVPPVEAYLEMGRPLAKFQFITVDLDEFITKVTKDRIEEALKSGDDPTKVPESVDLSLYKVVVRYSGWMANAFSMFTNRPSDSKPGYTFESTVRAINDKEATLGFDYVLVNGVESSVIMDIELYDEKNKLLSITEGIEVPIKRSKLTTVKGRFLMQEANGGVAINPSFDNEYNYEFNE